MSSHPLEPVVREGDGSHPTLLTAASDSRRVAIFRHRLRTVSFRIVADCERMLETLHAPEKRTWRDPVGEALIAARHLLAIIKAGENGSGDNVTQRLFSLGARILEPKRRIVDAMDRVLGMVPETVDDDLILHDARVVRTSAIELLALEERPTASAADVLRARDVPVARDTGPHAGHRMRVLVAEDDAVVRQVLERRLTRLQYAVLLASDGAEALELAINGGVDLILTDINMPRMDGISLLGRLKQDARTRDVPVIVISSQDDLASVARCIDQGAEDHLPKPYEPMILEARVRASLERKRMRDMELDYLRRVAALTEAAVAVERGTYESGSLLAYSLMDDPLAQLTRVFDRVVSGLKTREQRLKHRVRQLRREMRDSTSVAAAGVVIPNSPFGIGERVAGRYEILGHLGMGGMGMVYRALDQELHEEVALKVVRKDGTAPDPAVVDRLKSEIRLARRISHQNVVRAHDIGEWNGTYFISMEYVKGITLEDLIDRRGRLSVPSTLAIGTQIAEALAVAHEQQIIHRDIKPANLLIDEHGILKVMDFGIARMAQLESSLTMGGYVVGTPQYMAPELLLGGSAGTASDLYAVGMVLYECLTGRVPYDADSPLAIVARVSDGDVVQLSRLVPDLPDKLGQIVHQLIQLRAEARLPSARILASELAEIEHGPAGASSLPLAEVILEDFHVPD